MIIYYSCFQELNTMAGGGLVVDIPVLNINKSKMSCKRQVILHNLLLEESKSIKMGISYFSF